MVAVTATTVAAAALGPSFAPARLGSDQSPAFRLFSSTFHQVPRSSRSLASFLRPSSPATWNMDGNGDLSAKRKRSIVGAAERPSKHLKPEGPVLTPGDSTPANGTIYDIEEDGDAARTLPVGPTQTDSPEWQATIEAVVKSVVSIHFCQTWAFDTDLSMSSQATGFVVDAERGYILTNRHVVCAGPFWGYVIFDNHEEVSNRALLRTWKQLADDCG